MTEEDYEVHSTKWHEARRPRLAALPARVGVCPLCLKVTRDYPIQMYCADGAGHDLTPLVPYRAETDQDRGGYRC